MTNTTIREQALSLLRKGEATQSEVARLAGVGRQLVAYWARVAEIDPAETREKWLQKRWTAKP